MSLKDGIVSMNDETLPCNGLPASTAGAVSRCANRDMNTLQGNQWLVGNGSLRLNLAELNDLTSLVKAVLFNNGIRVTTALWNAGKEG